MSHSGCLIGWRRVQTVATRRGCDSLLVSFAVGLCTGDWNEQREMAGHLVVVPEEWKWRATEATGVSLQSGLDIQVPPGFPSRLWPP